MFQAAGRWDLVEAALTCECSHINAVRQVDAGSPWHHNVRESHADQLRACRSDTAYEEEIDCLWNAIDAYEARRWATARPSEAVL